jgi:ketosteroid isomerase-like protein
MHPPQKDAVDPQINEQLNALCKKFDEAYNNNNDAAAPGALFTEDAVVVTDTGPIYGQEAIEKYDADVFKQVHFSNHLDKCDEYGAHIIGTYRNGWQ